MKIFSNFDTELSARLYKKLVDMYGRENVLYVRRDKVYLYIRLVFPTILWIFLTIILLWIYYGLVGTSSIISDYVGFLVRGSILSMFVYLLYYTSHKLINYYLDFVLVTPKQVMAYDQEGILTRSTRSLDTDKIKTIHIAAQGRLSSIFNYGSIVFLAEGDRETGDVTLKFISRPVHLRDRIYAMIELRDQFEDDLPDQKV